MDRRTKLAFLLIALVLGTNLVFMERMGPKRRPVPAETSGGGNAGSAAPTVAPPAGSGAGAEPPASAVAPGSVVPSPGSPVSSALFTPAAATDPEILVRTPLYEVRLATAGGVITSLRLQQFDLANDGKVDLIPASLAGPGRAALGLRLDTPSGPIDLTRSRFDLTTPLPTTGVLEVAAGGAPLRLTMRCAARDGGAILEHWSFDPAKYDIGLELELERGAGIPEVSSYTLQWTSGLASTEVNHKDDWASFKVAARVDDQVHKHGLARMFGGGAGEKVTNYTGRVDWVGAQTKYFTVVLLPQTQEGGTLTLRTDVHAHWHGFELTNPVAWKKGPREIYTLYAGPIDVDLLSDHGRSLESIVDLGWTWVRPISKLIQAGMGFVHKFVPNYGVVILILSTLTQLLFWPLTEKSFKSMRKMQNLQPVVQEMKRRYKDDPQEMNRQMMALWRKEGVNPMGGCMPMLVQIPVLFALYSALRSSIDLRGAPFLLWIDNLAAPDVLFHLPFPIPGLGREICLLPLLMGAAMVWRSAISPTMPGATGAAAQQQAIMKWAMPVVMIFIFYKMPSGLVLYWLVNSLLGVWQQTSINRKFAPAAVTAYAPAVSATQGGKEHAATSRGDGGQRGRGAGQSAGRVGGKAR